MVSSPVAAKLIGIHNESHTCYISSVLQTIFALPVFMKNLADFVVPPLEQHAFPGFRGLDILQQSVSQHLVSLYEALAQKNRICSAKNIRVHLGKDYKEYNDHGLRQHDAGEFLDCLLKAIENDFVLAAAKVMSVQPQQLSKELCTAVQECTPAMQYLACRINHDLTCDSCHFQRSKIDCCNLVHLDLPPVGASRSISLESLFEFNFNEVALERRCDQNCPGKKSSTDCH